MKLKEILEHIVFGFVLSGVFGILAFAIIGIPIFSTDIYLEKIVRIFILILIEIGLFISGVIYSINYDI